MKTIEKILWYPVIPEYNLELLRKAGIFNGTWTKEINFDSIIDEAFRLLTVASVFDTEKALRLRKDIEQLTVRHDSDTAFKIGFFYSNRRLAIWLYKLLYKFPFKYRIGVSSAVFFMVNGETARENYKLIK